MILTSWNKSNTNFRQLQFLSSPLLTSFYFHLSVSQRIRTSGLLLLEMILCGSLLLYFPVSLLQKSPFHGLKLIIKNFN